MVETRTALKSDTLKIGLKISVVCFILLVCVYVSHSVMSDSLWPYRLWPTRLLCPLNYPSKNTRADYHAFLQGIFPTQGSNPSLLHCKADSLPPELPGKPFILVGIPQSEELFSWNSEISLLISLQCVCVCMLMSISVCTHAYLPLHKCVSCRKGSHFSNYAICRTIVNRKWRT